MRLWFNHLTINSGDVCKSQRPEVPDAMLRKWIFKGLYAPGKVIPMPDPLADYGATFGSESGALIVTVWGNCSALPFNPTGGQWCPILTFGIADNKKQSDVLWPTLQNLFSACVMALPSQATGNGPTIHPPDPPWCSVVVSDTILFFMDTTAWLADFERRVAWAWLTKNTTPPQH
jgi:hypothetical protein